MKYAPFVGVEPAVQSDAPAFLIQFKGPIGFPLANEMADNPVCIYVNGEASTYLTGGYTPNGQAPVTPLPQRAKPEFSLPSLAP